MTQPIKELIQNAPVHKRTIEVKTYPLDDGRLVVEGWLKDHRLCDGYHWEGTKTPPGIIHGLYVRWLVGGWPLTILDAETDMLHVPHELCPTAGVSVRSVIGMPIVAGFSSEARRRIGGPKGCTHLTHLMLVMAPAALHGYWTEQARSPRPLPDRVENVPGMSHLVNSCLLWREGGPIIEKIRKAILEKHAEVSAGAMESPGTSATSFGEI